MRLDYSNFISHLRAYGLPDKDNGFECYIEEYNLIQYSLYTKRIVVDSDGIIIMRFYHSPHAHYDNTSVGGLRLGYAEINRRGIEWAIEQF